MIFYSCYCVPVLLNPKSPTHLQLFGINRGQKIQDICIWWYKIKSEICRAEQIKLQRRKLVFNTSTLQGHEHTLLNKHTDNKVEVAAMSEKLRLVEWSVVFSITSKWIILKLYFSGIIGISFTYSMINTDKIYQALWILLAEYPPHEFGSTFVVHFHL